MAQTTVEGRPGGAAERGDAAGVRGSAAGSPHPGASGPRPPGPGPRRVVARECARALVDALLLPVRALGYTWGRGRAQAELRRLLDRPAPVEDPPAEALHVPTDRPLRVFLSCAEPSGELHAASLLASLREELAARGAPPPEVVGLGGPRLAQEGVELVADTLAHAAMGADVRHELGFWIRTLTAVARRLRDTPFDLVLPVDSPALHVPLGHIAHAYRTPVVHFVTPQYWGWAPWRVGGYARAVDLALTILPFEPAWFAARGVPTAHVGHPLQDRLAEVEARPGSGDGGRTLVVLPGSRASVVDRNLPWMLATVARMRLEVPDVEVLLPHDRAELGERIRAHVDAAGAQGWARVETGSLHDALAGARAALSVSGTILIDLLHHRLPAVVVYRVGGAAATWAGSRFLTVPWFSSVNLLAGREVLPEFAFHGEGPQGEVAAALARAFADEDWRRDCRVGLEEAARRLGPAGAARRAARLALGALPAPPPGPSTPARAR